ncbi:hypothetical protein EXU57_05005 [Segetibacter sp. 3557_3]|uniref:DUF6252 family protein n=1 Tax=Segetibacter sp. 3557_3 TaxID=2547429 RepID=UPI001058CA03|nr:DUF6252 family protein [Segetibacter sp. 3557_3]TDH27827.1 hypothetical protein EXU57_05005 [Segetibacter sp. 3557_3]
MNYHFLKRFRLLPILLAFTFVACQKELSEDILQAPPARPAPFEANVNGSRWVADNHYAAAFTQASPVAPRMLTIKGTSNNRKFLTISLVDSGVHNYTISPTGAGLNVASFEDSIVSPPLLFQSNQAPSANFQPGNVRVTSIDTVRKTISGTFEFRVFRTTDKSERAISMGVFTSIPFTATAPAAPADTLKVNVNGSALDPDTVSAAMVAPIPSANIPFYIIVGQSNTGWCSAKDMTPQETAIYRRAIPNTSIWNPGVAAFSTTWQPLHVGNNTMCENYVDRAQFGPEASLFLNMNNRDNRERLLFKLGKGGTTIATDWKPPVAGAPQHTAGGTWQQFDQWLTLAIDQAVAAGKKPELKGFIFMQGEDDGLLVADANAYLANLTTFFNAFEGKWQQFVTKYNLASGPYKKVIGRIFAPTGYPFKDIVRTAQQAYCANPANNATMINCDNYPLQDWVHYSATGQIQFGLDIFNSVNFEPAPTLPIDNLVIKASNSTRSRNVTIILPANITPGSYSFTAAPGLYTAEFVDGAARYQASTGTLQVLENNPAVKRIRANFTLRAQPAGSTTPVADLTEGFLSVRY